MMAWLLSWGLAAPVVSSEVVDRGSLRRRLSDDDADLALLLASEQEGRVGPCVCTLEPLGGLSRIDALARAMRRRHPAVPVVILGAGGLLSATDRSTDASMAEAADLFDALLATPSEHAGRLATVGLPWVSATSEAVPAVRTVQAGAVTVAITGVTGPRAVQAVQAVQGLPQTHADLSWCWPSTSRTGCPNSSRYRVSTWWSRRAGSRPGMAPLPMTTPCGCAPGRAHRCSGSFVYGFAGGRSCGLIIAGCGSTPVSIDDGEPFIPPASPPGAEGRNRGRRGPESRPGRGRSACWCGSGRSRIRSPSPGSSRDTAAGPPVPERARR